MTDHTTIPWRLILSEPLPGADNMAIDEALLSCFDPGTSLPVLRLYRWSPPALSLGRFQKADEALNLERCRADGVAVVRRITGGGTIYHTDELTYSLVCAPYQIPPASSVKDSFRVLTGFLLTFYRGLGLEADYAVDTAPEGTRLGERTPFCFAGRETFDILVNGCKIGGNAQRRTKGIIFQHGSIPLLNRASTGLCYMRDNTPHLAAGVTALAECGVAADLPGLGDRLAAAFADTFEIDLRCGTLSAQESQAAQGLVPLKYAREAWNLEGAEQ
ncbi:lipoate--protein ligase family protein [Geobacter sp. SVR]|uniref:lipoate--protein ligase family protein n=1 Tax=Geobacter sp. SVR TaxID=2495594 RepID=UPI00143EFF6D|nr:lipoate--protein ligase family protein [Geobacter sp. SVR]BCS54605.1 lipoate--protein ligase [Geobacter sp. SVR]GCF86888.1 lipoate--protein ligase [Geobacter sp. SVR]